MTSKSPSWVKLVLAVQVAPVVDRLMAEANKASSSAVECSPGSGQLALDLVRELLLLHPDLAGRGSPAGKAIQAWWQQVCWRGRYSHPGPVVFVDGLKRVPVLMLFWQLLDALLVEQLIWSGGN